MSLTSYKSNGVSGKKDATASAVAVVSAGSGEVNGQVIIQVESTESSGVEVIFAGSTDGIIVSPGESVSFLSDDLAKVEVKRVGGSDIEFRYWAF